MQMNCFTCLSSAVVRMLSVIADADAVALRLCIDSAGYDILFYIEECVRYYTITKAIEQR
jgi:hypothetical protein